MLPESLSFIGPSWAKGCQDCNCGIQIEPQGLVKWTTSIYLRRAAGWKLDAIIFCECRAGHMQRQHARKMWSRHGNDYLLGQARNAIEQPPTVRMIERDPANSPSHKQYRPR